MENNSNNSIGALWIKKSAKGVSYLSGNIEINGQKIKIAVLKNTYKKTERQPDYRILQSTPIQSKAEKMVRDTFQDDIPF